MTGPCRLAGACGGISKILDTLGNIYLQNKIYIQNIV